MDTQQGIHYYGRKNIFTVIVQSGFHISQEEIGWNSQHHSKLINETKSLNLKYQFIHLTNEAGYWWLIAVL